MHHLTPLISTMPVRRPWRTPNDITHSDLLRLAALVADPACSGEDAQQLSSQMVMPVRACARGEVYVDDGHVVGREHRVNPGLASEPAHRGAAADGLLARVGVAYDYHLRHAG